MKHEDSGTKSARKRVAVIGTVLATALLGLFMTAGPSLATSVTTAQMSSHSLAADVSAAAAIRPRIKELSCDDKTAFRIEMKSGTYCYGFDGIVLFEANATRSVCAGNNYGTLRYYDPEHNEYHTWDFAPGHVAGWTYYVDVDSLTITGYSGSDKC